MAIFMMFLFNIIIKEIKGEKGGYEGVKSL